MFTRNRWWIVAAGVIALSCGAGPVNIFTFGVFLKPLTEALGLGRGQFGAAQALTNVLSAITGPVLGHWLDKYGARPVLIVGEPEFRVAMIAWDKVRGRLSGDKADNIPFFYAGFAERVRGAQPGDDALYV